MAALSLLPSALWLFCLTSFASAIKYNYSRAKLLELVRGKEGRLHFSNCDQSSLNAACIFAVDDNYSQEPTQCAITNQESSPWWIGVLENPSYVTKVSLLNIDQTYRSQGDALRGVTIMAGDDICFQYESAESFNKRSFPCDSVTDQITIKSNQNSAELALCDVEVFGAPIKFSDVLNAPKALDVVYCEQSSIDGNGNCENAFNGDANSNHNAKPCAVTMGEENPWLEAVIRIPSLVTEIRLFNRGDCCAEGLKHFKLTLNNRLCVEHNGEFASMAFPCKYFGNTVRITSQLSVAMSICEMQLLGYESLLQFPRMIEPKGCYKDDSKNRDLTQLVSSTTMRHEKCHKMCKRLGFKYFGVQNGRHCFCGSSYGKHGKVDDKECSVPCDDNEKEMCGGSTYNSVFENKCSSEKKNEQVLGCSDD